MPATARVLDKDEFQSVPPGSIPASRSGVYRADHFDRRAKIYVPAVMQQQQPYDLNNIRRQQMQQQVGCKLD